MAFRVRKSHSLLLGLVGIILIMYSAYYSNSGYLFLEYGPRTPLPSVSLNVSSKVAVNIVNGVSQLSPLSSEPFKGIKTVTNISNSDGSPTGKTSSGKDVAGKALKSGTSTASSKIVSAPAAESSTQNTTLREVPKQMNSQSTAKSSTTVKTAVKVGSSDPADKAVLTSTVFDSGYFIANENICLGQGEDLHILILITSAPNHSDARMAIRQTWGSFMQRKDVAVAFLLGSVQDSKINDSLIAESEMYGDIIMSRFIDAYNNLTLKTISMLEWVDNYCSKVKYVLKTDDDMFINIPRLLSFVTKHSKDKRTIFGRLAKKWKPIRNKKSKYYVSPNQYHPSVFPDFTTGPAYLITGDVVHELYATSLNKTYLKLEDVFVTGIVAQDRKIKRTHANEFMNKRLSFNPCTIQKVVSIHMVKFHEQFDLWKKLLDGRAKCSR